MKISISGHRPDWLKPHLPKEKDGPHSYAFRTDLRSPDEIPEPPKTVHIGLVKLMIYPQTGRQRSLLSYTPSTPAPSTRKKYEAYLNAWAKKENAATGKRKEAVKIIKSWMNRDESGEWLEDDFEDYLDDDLDLSGLKLTSLPEHLPPNLRRLTARVNRLETVPLHLPNNLVELDMSDNPIRSLAAKYPPSVTILDFSFCGLQELTDDFPEGIEILYFNSNPISTLPDTLPSTIKTIYLDQCPALTGQRQQGLTSLTQNLPASLEVLSLVNNRVASLPEQLPNLRELDLRNNCLNSLPTNLPRSLKRLILDKNNLPNIPENIIEQLGSDAVVSISENPLSDHVRENLRAITSANGYAGPTFHFSMESLSGHPPEHPLERAISKWHGTNSDTIRKVWAAFQPEAGAGDFSKFLDRLNATVNAGNPAFRERIVEWLAQLATRPTLRAQTFMRSTGASASCEDRVSLAMNDMKKLRMASDVEDGKYDNRLAELIDLASGAFRLDALERIARDKVKTLRFVDEVEDEVEVYLAYQVSLRVELNLPLETADMRSFHASFLTDDDLIAANQRVNAEEIRDFSDYLSSEWAPLQSVMKRLDPKGYSENQGRLMKAMGADFDHELKQRLQDVGMCNDDDAIRQLGKQVRDDIMHRINGEYTAHFLKVNGMD